MQVLQAKVYQNGQMYVSNMLTTTDNLHKNIEYKYKIQIQKMQVLQRRL